MSYKNLTAKQIYMGKVNYTLDDFMKDFREKMKKDWDSELAGKKNKAKALYQGIFIIIVLASQKKPLKIISELVFGKSTEKLKITKGIIAMYGKEVKVLESLQMKMFLNNLKKYRLSDSLNLKLLNADFRIWLKKILNCKN